MYKMTKKNIFLIKKLICYGFATKNHTFKFVKSNNLPLCKDSYETTTLKALKTLIFI